MRNIATVLTLMVVLPALSNAAETPSCPNADGAVTTPALVQTSAITDSLTRLRTTQGTPAVDLTPAVTLRLKETFDTSQVLTKMEQFYRLLYLISGARSRSERVALESGGVRDLLLTTGVFTDPQIPRRITAVELDGREKGAPLYLVRFDTNETAVPLNKGEGFFLLRNGKCQHAQKLIFRSEFSFNLKENPKGNLVAYNFNGVDLFGDFGNRGMIDVDINYVSLRAVEFYKGTVNGKVTAYVSREEFKKNDHNPFLSLITRFVPDRSVQPIDW